MSVAHLLACLIIAWPLSGQQRVLPYPVEEIREFSSAVADGTRTRTGAPGEAYWSNTADYVIKAQLNPATARVDGHVKITYRNASRERLRNLVLHLRQNLHRQGVVRNVPVHITGGMSVTDVSVGGKKLKSGSGRSGAYRISGTTMSLRPHERIEPGSTVLIEMDFSFIVPPTSGARRMGHEKNHVFYLGYWYPQMAVYEDVRGWVAEPYMGGGEFYMGYGNYDLELTAPHGWIVRATGSLQNAEKVLPLKIRKRLEKARKSREIVHVVRAAERGPGKSTLRSSKGKLTWRFKAENVRDCAVSVSDRYVWDATHAVVKKDEGTATKSSPDLCMIHAVYEPEGAVGKAWQRGAEYARHTIEYMSANVMPYPWPHMTACEGIVGGGMEYPMMTCVGAGRWGPMLQSVISHELIHMWFPMIVGTDEKTWCWMDEGLTDFFTTLVDSDFRQEAGPIKMAYVQYRDMARTGREVPCMSHADSFNESNRGPFYFASYGKPCAAMHQLKGMLGEKAFMRAIKIYVDRWAYKHPHPVDLFRTFSEVAGQDLGWYFRTWFFETWTLDHKVAEVTKANGGTAVTIEDIGQAIGPTEVVVVYENGSQETQTVPASHWLSGKRSKVLTFKDAVKEVRIDPRSISLDVNQKNNVWDG